MGKSFKSKEAKEMIQAFESTITETIVQLENPMLKIERSVSKIHPPPTIFTLFLFRKLFCFFFISIDYIISKHIIFYDVLYRI